MSSDFLAAPFARPRAECNGVCADSLHWIFYRGNTAGKLASMTFKRVEEDKKGSVGARILVHPRV